MKNKPMTYCYDLDGTICITTNKNYKDAIPRIPIINFINSQYDAGNYITIFTARGGTSGVNYHNLTVNQLKEWNVKYHQLIDQNKPHFDFLIDDKAINIDDWCEINKIENTSPINIKKLIKQNKMSYIETYFSEVIEIIQKINHDDIEKIITAIKICKQNQGRIFVIGVGGSAANASHAVNDFRKICGIETYSVSENVAELTARINDVGWDTCYSEWLKTSKISPNDILLVFSVGGGSDKTSVNLVKAMEFANQCKSTVLSIVSRDGGKAKELSDVCLLIPVVSQERITPHAEEWQGIILHLIVNGI